MKTHHVKQGTRDWYMLRLGKPTASCFDRIITPKTGKASAQQDWYLFDLLAERVMGCPPEDVQVGLAVEAVFASYQPRDGGEPVALLRFKPRKG